MQLKFTLKNLDCPNCASIIEKEAGKLKSVTAASVNLMNQMLTLEMPDGNEEEIFCQVKKIVQSREPDVEVVPFNQSCTSRDHSHACDCGSHHKHDKEHHSHGHSHENGSSKAEALKLMIGGVLFLAAIIFSRLLKLSEIQTFAVYLIPYLVLGYDVILTAAKNLFKGRVFDENFLMSLATIGAFAIKEYAEGAAVMLFYGIGEYFQSLSVRRSRKSIKALLDVRPDKARVERDGVYITVHPKEVKTDEIILVKPGENIPLDGIIISGSATLDTCALTGESKPADAYEGETVLAGFINKNGLLKIKVTKCYGETTASKIIELAENASQRKAKTEKFITVFARYYTPVVVIAALLIAFLPPVITSTPFSSWIHRALVFLVVSCPCALVISVPLAYFSGIGKASRRGILVKGSNCFDALKNADIAVFDKTGTLTKGSFAVSDIIPENGFTVKALLNYTAAAESTSNHPIAEAILRHHGKAPLPVTQCKEKPGFGITAKINEKTVLVGNKKLMDAEDIVVNTTLSSSSTAVYTAINGIYAGCIILQDEIKPDSRKAIETLKSMGITQTIMLTGDNEGTAHKVAQSLGIDEFRHSLLPHEKAELLEKIKAESSGKVIYVGDGINDAPVLAGADVGVAMGALGSDAAIENADVVLMTDELTKLTEALEIARTTHFKVIRNIIFALSVKFVILIFGAFGIAGMWTAVFGDVGVALIAVLLSL